MTDAHEPIACSLSSADAAAQVQEWTDLQRRALTAERHETGIVMTFPPDLAATVEDLAARERACCGFLSITTTRTDDGVRIEISSGNPDAQPVVETFQDLISEVDIR